MDLTASLHTNVNNLYTLGLHDRLFFFFFGCFLPPIPIDISLFREDKIASSSQDNAINVGEHQLCVCWKLVHCILSSVSCSLLESVVVGHR